MINRAEEIKYRIFWVIGTVLAFILYYFGIAGFYIFFRNKICRKQRNIVLTYHRIRDDEISPDISVSVKNFERQMLYLKKRFHVISLDELINNMGKNTATLMNNVAITFDDGYRDNYISAYPVLKNFKFPATIFLVSKTVGARDDMLDIDEIKIMKSNGISFGSHTATHKALTQIDKNMAGEEILHSKEELETLLKEGIQFFAYPVGKKKYFNEQVKDLVRKSGYKAAFTTENGGIDAKSDLFALKRIGIRNCPLFVFKVRVSGIFECGPVYLLRWILRLT